MATEFKHKITTPFAQNGTRTEIPQTSSDGSVSFDQGYTDVYSKKPSEGGKYVGRVPINYLFYLVTAALQEIQEIIINGDIDALKKLQEDIQQGNIPVNMENARNILSVQNGGTGVNDGRNFKNYIGEAGSLVTVASKKTLDYIDKINKHTSRNAFVVEFDGSSEDYIDVPDSNIETLCMIGRSPNYIAGIGVSVNSSNAYVIGTIYDDSNRNKQWKQLGFAPKITELSGGTWIETPLNNGKVLLEGSGVKNIKPAMKSTANAQSIIIINLPFNIVTTSAYANVSASYEGAINPYECEITTHTQFYKETVHFRTYYRGDARIGTSSFDVHWYIRAIKA